MTASCLICGETIESAGPLSDLTDMHEHLIEEHPEETVFENVAGEEVSG